MSGNGPMVGLVGSDDVGNGPMVGIGGGMRVITISSNGGARVSIIRGRVGRSSSIGLSVLRIAGLRVGPTVAPKIGLRIASSSCTNSCSGV